MVINNVRIFLHHGESNLKATVTVLVNNQILLQAGQSILAQANHQPEMLLRLLE